MTVAELMDALKQAPPNAPVYVWIEGEDFDYMHNTIDFVQVFDMDIPATYIGVSVKEG